MECFNILLKIGNSLPTIFTLKQLSQFLSPKNFGIKIIPALMSQEVRIVHIKHQRLTIGTWQQQAMKHGHFKILDIPVSNMYRCLTQWGHSCMRVLIVLGGKKIFTNLKKFLLIINMFLKILIVVIYVNNLK